MKEMTKAQTIKAFNENNRPFYLVDHGDKVSLCCVFHPTPYSKFSLGQEAFNRYAESIGDPVTDRYGFFTHGSGYEWEYVFRKAFENDPGMEKISFDCEAGGFFCYCDSVDMLADFGHRFREMLNDTESFTELVCRAIPEGRQREAELRQFRCTVKGFLMEHPNATVDLMTLGGYVHLTPERGKALLDGIPVPAHPGASEGIRLVDAEEILDQRICACNQDSADENHYAMITEQPSEDESQEFEMTM